MLKLSFQSSCTSSRRNKRLKIPGAKEPTEENLGRSPSSNANGKSVCYRTPERSNSRSRQIDNAMPIVPRRARKDWLIYA